MCQSHYRHLLHIGSACQSYVRCVRYPLVRRLYWTLVTALPATPIEAFQICMATGSFHLEISLHAIAAVFGGLFGSLVATASCSQLVVSDASVFSIIIFFAYSNLAIFRFSSLVRTIVVDATVYYIMVMGLQILVLFFLSLADVRHRSLPIFILLTHSLLDYDQSIPSHVRTPIF